MTLFYLSIAFLMGIALAPESAFPFPAFLISGILSLLLALTTRNRLRLILCCCAAFLLGGARWDAAQPAPGPAFLGAHLNRHAEMEVVLEEDAQPWGDGVRFRARVDKIRLPEEEIGGIEGMVLVEFTRTPDDWEARFGDRAAVSGLLAPPPEIDGFDYPAYLARQGVYAVLCDPHLESVQPEQGDLFRSTLYAFRRNALAKLRELFPEPEGSLLAGILLGEESGIPEDLKEAFSRTGTSHIVAISGFNISIVAGIFLALTKRIPRKYPGWLLAAIGIGLYTVLVGASASVVRAAVMGTLALFARSLGRQSHGLTSLAFAGALMTLANPWTLWDIGFQLSFAATLGLILYADPIQKRVEQILAARIPKERARAAAGTASEVLLLTVAAQITTLPLMLYHFRSFSPGALLINPLVLSVQPAVMIAGGLALLLGMVWLPAGQAISWLGWAPTAYTIRVVEWGAGWPAGWWPIGEVSPWTVLIFYGALFGVTALSAKGKFPQLGEVRTRTARMVAAGVPVLILSTYAAWNFWFSLPDGRLHMMLLDTGASAVLIRSPSGAAVLVDAGGEQNAAVAALGKAMGFWRRRLDWVIVASIAEENNSELAGIAERYEIGGVLLPPRADRKGKALAAFLAICDSRGVPVLEAREGYLLDLGDGSRISVLADGEGGLVLAVERGETGPGARWLILSGLDAETGRRMLAQGRVPGAQVLLLASPSKKGGTPAEWWREANPVLGIGPSAENLAWPERIPLLSADVHGWVDVATDGQRLWIYQER